MRRYWHILRKYKISLALCPILVLITVWCETIQPMYMAEIVDQGVMKRDLSLIAEKGVYMILISLSGLGFSVVNVYIASRTSIGFGTDLRGALFEKIQRLSFFDLDHFSTSSLITRLTNEYSTDTAGSADVDADDVAFTVYVGDGHIFCCTDQ